MARLIIIAVVLLLLCSCLFAAFRGDQWQLQVESARYIGIPGADPGAGSEWLRVNVLLTNSSDNRQTANVDKFTLKTGGRMMAPDIQATQVAASLTGEKRFGDRIQIMGHETESGFLVFRVPQQEEVASLAFDKASGEIALGATTRTPLALAPPTTTPLPTATAVPPTATTIPTPIPITLDYDEWHIEIVYTERSSFQTAVSCTSKFCTPVSLSLNMTNLSAVSRMLQDSDFTLFEPNAKKFLPQGREYAPDSFTPNIKPPCKEHCIRGAYTGAIAPGATLPIGITFLVDAEAQDISVYFGAKVNPTTGQLEQGIVLKRFPKP